MNFEQLCHLFELCVIGISFPKFLPFHRPPPRVPTLPCVFSPYPKEILSRNHLFCLVTHYAAAFCFVPIVSFLFFFLKRNGFHGLGLSFEPSESTFPSLHNLSEKGTLE